MWNVKENLPIYRPTHAPVMGLDNEKWWDLCMMAQVRLCHIRGMKLSWPSGKPLLHFLQETDKVLPQPT